MPTNLIGFLFSYSFLKLVFKFVLSLRKKYNSLDVSQFLLLELQHIGECTSLEVTQIRPCILALPIT